MNKLIKWIKKFNKINMILNNTKKNKIKIISNQIKIIKIMMYYYQK
jgi:hypothetical protein